MQQDTFSYTIDPSFLDLKAYPITHYQNTVSSLDEDVAIASGQAGFDHGEDGNANTYSKSRDDEHFCDHFASEDLDIGFVQNTDVSGIFPWYEGEFGSHTASLRADYSSVGEAESQSHLSAFASDTSSALGLNDTHLRNLQHGALSEISSKRSGSSLGSSRGSHDYSPSFRLQQKSLRDSYLTQCAHSSGSFAIPTVLTSTIIEPRSIPRDYLGCDFGMGNMGSEPKATPFHFKQGTSRDLTDECWQELQPAGQTASEPFWQEPQNSYAWTDGTFDSANARLDQEHWTRQQHLIPGHSHRASHQRAVHATPRETFPGYPGAIMIPASSRHYDAGQTSSFPPTAGRFPNYVPTLRSPEHRRPNLSTSQATMEFPKQRSLPMRRTSSKTKGSGRSQSVSLRAIQEHDYSLSRSPTGSFRGRRKGQLDAATALAAGQKRSDGTCEGVLPCEGCRKNLYARSWQQPCQKARFMDMVEAGTCNAVFQRSASIRSFERNQRVCLQYPGIFDIYKITHDLRTRASEYNIRVCHFSGSSYTLDLAAFAKLISTVHKVNDKELCELDDFGRHRALKASDWLDCVTDFDKSSSILDRSIIWNNMPSRNDYFYLPLDGDFARPIYVSDNDNSDILLAVRLCRIVLRALEFKAFSILQSKVNDLSKFRHSYTDLETLAQALTKILFSLRWRISWWTAFGIHSEIQDQLSDSYVERVTMLTQTLYLWYFVVRRKLPAWAVSTPKGTLNCYGDAAQEVFEEFPADESINGFNAWMAHGQGLIREANVHQPLP